MRVTVRFQLLLLSIALALPAAGQETHLSEPGAGPILFRSAFAHGYRHGYEEGYRTGNIDVNMGRPVRTKASQFHGLQTGYSSRFGSRDSFLQGFDAGLQAGYSDGYTGRVFRAVALLRTISSMIDDHPVPSDPDNSYFDQGFAKGYATGRERGASDGSGVAEVEFRFVNCSQSEVGRQQFPARPSYCDGYRRGFALGHSDGFTLRPERRQLEASK